MKNYIISSLLLVAFLVAAPGIITAGSNVMSATEPTCQQEDQLTNHVNQLRQAVTPDEIETAVIALEKISEASPNNWRAHYHTAYGYGRLAHSTSEVGKVDGWIDTGEAALARAKTCTDATADELLVVEAYLTYARIKVNPFIRGYKYGGIAVEFLKEARQINEENPRIYLLFSQHLINAPAIIGGDVDKACEFNIVTREKLTQEFARTDRHPLAPSWGKGECDSIAKEYCGGDTAEMKKRDE